MKYVIIKTGGKQIKTWVGESIWIEKISNKVGEEVIFDDILALYDEKNFYIGKPKIDAKIKGIVEKQGKNKKIIIFRTKQKSNWSKKQGHRQPYTRIYVTEILLKNKVIDRIELSKNNSKEQEIDKTENINKIQDENRK